MGWKTGSSKRDWPGKFCDEDKLKGMKDRARRRTVRSSKARIVRNGYEGRKQEEFRERENDLNEEVTSDNKGKGSPTNLKL